MVLGTPGGPTIITTVAQIILYVLDHGMTLADAVAAPPPPPAGANTLTPGHAPV